MSIFQKIEEAVEEKIYDAINFKHHLKELNSRDYDFLFKELRFNNSFHFIDKDYKYNLIIQVENEKQIEGVVKNRKNINITRDENGPILELNIEGFIQSFLFYYDLNSNVDLYKLKILIRNKEANLHFVINNGSRVQKIFSAILDIDERIIERLHYMINLSYFGCYPSIDFIMKDEASGKCLEIDGDKSILEDIIVIIENLQKWGSKDSFDVLVSNNEFYNVMFIGNISNFNYIKNDLVKKYKILNEGMSNIKGVPFIKYDRGMIYFYKNRFSNE